MLQLSPSDLFLILAGVFLIGLFSGGLFTAYVFEGVYRVIQKAKQER